MKSNRHARNADAAGAEVIGAILLFGVFVTAIALLNVTAVPQAGLAAEDEHVRQTLDDLNALQLDAENAGLPGRVGATVGRALQLSPTRDVGQDFFSHFLATPARASGDLTFERDYGNLSLHHYRGAPPGAVYDIGSTTTGLTMGRLTFDPNPIFRAPGLFQLEGGGAVSTEGGTASMRLAPPVTVSIDDQGITHVGIRARVFNGTEGSIGGTTTVRVTLTTEAATLANPATDNANSTVLRLETSHGSAWGRQLNQTAANAGLPFWDAENPTGTEKGYYTKVRTGAGKDGLDVVEWRVYGLDNTPTKRDIRLVSGIAVYALDMG